MMIKFVTADKKSSKQKNNGVASQLEILILHNPGNELHRLFNIL